MKKFIRVFAIIPFLALGCSMETSESTDQAEALGEQHEALTGWIGPVSEESFKQWATCGSADTGVTQARCVGRYCDDMYLMCQALPTGTTLPYANSYWEDWISDEAPNNERMCDMDNDGVIDGVVIGVQASGRYADSVSVQCARLAAPLGNRYCTWTGWFSEEQGLLDFGGMKAVGVGCSGSYCDNMRYRVCQF